MLNLALSIIIVSYKVRQDLQECLESVYSSNFNDIFEVIVVDNNSNDGTIEMVRSLFPQAHLIPNIVNDGFPKANNQALKVANGDYVLFLNPDTILMANTLSVCVTFMRQNASVGLMGCKALYPDGRIQFECARNFPTLDAMIWEALYLHMLFPTNRCFGKTLMSYWDHRDSRDIPCLLGAFMLGRAYILKQIGGMDTSVFMYYEDIDLCYRVRALGWRIFYLSDASIIHKTGRSSKKNINSLVIASAEARYAYFRKHFGIGKARICWLIIFVQGIFRFGLSLPLFSCALVFRRLRHVMPDVCKPNKHWYLIRWSLSCLPSLFR